MTSSMQNALSILAALAALAIVPGCSAAADDDTSAETDSDAEEALTQSAAKKLVGRYSAKSGIRPPTFRTLRLNDDRTFEAMVDRGIRCVRAPCPSFVSFYGTYSAGAKTITLKAAEGSEDGGYAGRYRYKLESDGTVHLTRTGSLWQNWSNDLERAPGILPDDATKVVAESPGGGFMRPAPAGSNCAGQQKYTLDLQTRAFTWSYCEYSNSGPWLTKSGASTLSTADASRIVEAYAHASIYEGDSCGADKPFLKVKVTSPAGTKEYLDSFYSCHQQGTYIEGIGEIFSAMSQAAK